MINNNIKRLLEKDLRLAKIGIDNFLNEDFLKCMIY